MKQHWCSQDIQNHATASIHTKIVCISLRGLHALCMTGPQQWKMSMIVRKSSTQIMAEVLMIFLQQGMLGTTYTTSYISGSIRSNSRTFNDLALGSKQDKDDFCKFIYCVQRTFILLLHECYFPRTCIRLCLAHLNVHCMCAYVIVCVCIHWCERVCIACVCACVLGYVWVCLCLYMHVCLDCFLHWCCMFKL